MQPIIPCSIIEVEREAWRCLSIGDAGMPANDPSMRGIAGAPVAKYVRHIAVCINETHHVGDYLAAPGHLLDNVYFLSTLIRLTFI